MEDINKMLHSKDISKKEKELLLYKDFCDSLINYNSNIAIENISILNKFNNLQSIFLAYIHSSYTYNSLKAIMKFEDFFNNNYNVEENYQNIINKVILLAKELNLKSSLEYSNLFSYLLWKGYFSKDCKLSFSYSNRAMQGKNFSYDIMNGNGVCLNFSSMLRDFLDKSEYKSSILLSSFNNNKIKTNYKMNLKRKIIDNQSSNKFLDNLFNPVIKIIGHHAFVLINDNDNMYIYDPTNLLIAKIIDNSTAEVIEGTGKFKLKPWTSYDLCNDDTSKMLLDKLILTNDFSFNNSSNFSDTWNDNLNRFKENEFIFKDYHEEISKDIDKISCVCEYIKK